MERRPPIVASTHLQLLHVECCLPSGFWCSCNCLLCCKLRSWSAGFGNLFTGCCRQYQYTGRFVSSFDLLMHIVHCAMSVLGVLMYLFGHHVSCCCTNCRRTPWNIGPYLCWLTLEYTAHVQDAKLLGHACQARPVRLASLHRQLPHAQHQCWGRVNAVWPPRFTSHGGPSHAPSAPPCSKRGPLLDG
jgi:hypothetical protein